MRPDALTRLSIRHATPADAQRLAVFAQQAFVDTFAADNTAADMAMYVAASFGEAVQHAELSDARNTVLLAEQDGELVGYAMLREGPEPEAVAAHDAIEISRLYASNRLIGSGIGAALMQRSLDEAEHRGCDAVWLGVWEHNRRAIRFYERWGFVDVGSQPFTLGRDRQTDRIMSRAVGR